MCRLPFFLLLSLRMNSREVLTSEKQIYHVRLDKKRARGIKKAAKRGRYFAAVSGIVTENRDPDGQGRVKVKFPWLQAADPDSESAFARIALPMAGSGRGFFYLPEVGDEVLVVFEHGDIRTPIIIGVLWDGLTLPPGCSEDDDSCSCSKEGCDGSQL